jgi:hypothetical protein
VLLSRLRVALDFATPCVRQFAFLNVQEARYQFSGYYKIADAPANPATGNVMRIRKTLPPSLLPEKKA